QEVDAYPFQVEPSDRTVRGKSMVSGQFSFRDGFSWIKRSGLSSKRANWRQEGHGSAEYMRKRGRVDEDEATQATARDVINISGIPWSERLQQINRSHIYKPPKKQRLHLDHTGTASLYAEAGAGVQARSNTCIGMDIEVTPSGPASAMVEAGLSDGNGRRFWEDARVGQWPPTADVFAWRNGIKTILPYAGLLLGKVDEDVNAVETMAAAWDAEAGEESGNSPATFLTWNPLEMDKTGLQIREALSVNTTVVVRRWTFDGSPLDYGEKGLKRSRGSLVDPIQYHCAAKRIENRLCGKAGTVPHVNTSLREFLRLSNTEDACGNLMDSPEVNGPTPPFVAEVADDVWAWKVTAREGYEEEGIALQANAKRGGLQAREAAIKEARNSSDDATANQLGPRVATLDTVNLRHWDLVTMAGFFTWPHQDANGLCTWASIRDGAKLWGMIRFNSGSTSSRNSRKAMIDLFEKTAEFEFVIVLERGSAIIMPPGAWHEVYTPVNTVISDGHFLCYDALHLTQWSRLYDHMDKYATNADHVGVRRTLARMAIALRYVDR
ncbi:hypothetical protein BV25DRAFT_1843748, partial [Artomyces pyxidatus]